MTLNELLKTPQDELDKIAGRAVVLSLRARALESVDYEAAFGARLIAWTVLHMISDQVKHYDFLQQPEPSPGRSSQFEASGSMSGPRLSEADLAVSCSRWLDGATSKLDALQRKDDEQALPKDDFFAIRARGGTDFVSPSFAELCSSPKYNRYTFVLGDKLCDDEELGQFLVALMQQMAKDGGELMTYLAVPSATQRVGDQS